MTSKPTSRIVTCDYRPKRKPEATQARRVPAGVEHKQLDAWRRYLAITGKSETS